GVERTPWGTSLAWAPRSAEEESRPESTATTVSPSGTSAASRPAAGAASLAAGAGSMSLVRSKTAPPSTAPTTRRTAQTARTTARRRAASRPVRWSRRPSAMTVLLVENVGGPGARGGPTGGEHAARGRSAVGPRSGLAPPGAERVCGRVGRGRLVPPPPPFTPPWCVPGRADQPPAPGRVGQPQLTASYAASVSNVRPSPDADTCAEPASTEAARVANDWYAETPGSTPVTVFVPNGVVSVMSAGTVSSFVARTAT